MATLSETQLHGFSRVRLVWSVGSVKPGSSVESRNHRVSISAQALAAIKVAFIAPREESRMRVRRLLLKQMSILTRLTSRGAMKATLAEPRRDPREPFPRLAPTPTAWERMRANR